MDREKKMLTQAFSTRRSQMNDFLLISQMFKRYPKPAEASQAFRKAGNALFTKKSHGNVTHLEIFNDYCRAILTAPNDSEDLAFGYGNRSALLLHLEKYEDCITDIDRALEITKSDVLRVKLLCRKAECLKNLGSLEAEIVLQEVDKYIPKLSEEKKNIYSTLVEKIKNTTVNDHRYPPETERAVFETQDPTECITINYNEGFGRHLLAAKDYAPGEVIVVEKTYVTHINRRMIVSK